MTNRRAGRSTNPGETGNMRLSQYEQMFHVKHSERVKHSEYVKHLLRPPPSTSSCRGALAVSVIFLII